MKNYIYELLKIDAQHLISLSENEGKLPHPGVKGRFRELLINNALSPWLPPNAKCGTGMIIDGRNMRINSTQDDIVIYDQSLTPPVLASNAGSEGVFLYNSVLARIEVKSTLNNTELKKFISAAEELSSLNVCVQPECKKAFTGALNLLFSFKTDLLIDNDSDIKRLIREMESKNIDPLSGIVSMFCIPGRGFYKIGIDKDNQRVWQKLSSNNPLDHVVWFIGCLSNSCFKYLAERQGRDIQNSLEGGIGNCLDHPFETVQI